MEIEFYVLELEGARYYVGQSKEAERRIAAHFKGKGAAWTKRYKPVKVMRRWGSGLTNWKEAEREENRITLKLMSEHGWKKVRGGYWANTDAEQTRKNLHSHKLLIEAFGFDFEAFT